MIQLNLLPDVKLQFIKAQRTRRLVTSIAFIATAVSVGLLLLLLSVAGLQKKHLSDLNADIASNSEQLKKQPQIDKVLTVQNQLSTLTDLHNKKPAAERAFNYLNQVTPAEVGITDFKVTFTENKVQITGGADALNQVNKYVDTLKFTKYKTKDGSTQFAFKNVVLSSFSFTSQQGAASSSNKPASYAIDLEYDPVIFDNTAEVTLTVPAQVTTRSEVDQPSDLFQGSAGSSNQSGSGN